MKIRKALLLFLILLPFAMIVILPSSLNICLPYGCNFNSINAACNSNSCANETTMQHLNERTQLLSATIKLQLFMSLIIFTIIIIAFFAVQKYSENKRLIIEKFYLKQKLLNSSCIKLFDYLIKIFSSGILHPKIY